MSIEKSLRVYLAAGRLVENKTFTFPPPSAKWVRMIEFLAASGVLSGRIASVSFSGWRAACFYGLTNGLLLGVAKVVMDLIFIGATNFHDKLEMAPLWIRPFTHWLAAVLPEFHAPVSEFGWALVCSAIPAVMVLRITLAYLNIYLTNWAAMHAIADIRTKLFGHLQNLSLGFF